MGVARSQPSAERSVMNGGGWFDNGGPRVLTPQQNLHMQFPLCEKICRKFPLKAFISRMYWEMVEVDFGRVLG